ncbi:MAG: phosphodiester glycosidase family protein [Bacilli bacterium]|nr:phosphodiester glycosidase family protein [Bacilli bacterium]
MFKKWIMILCSVGITLYAIGCSAFLFILYGPIPNFREWLITTAMGTMNHQYYCKWFYSDERIADVLNNNYIIEAEGETNPDLIDKNKNDHNYKDEYEREILEHEDGELYKIIRFKVNGQNAYLAAVYDASKISVGVTKYLGEAGQYVWQMAKYYNAKLAINGGGFFDPNHNSNGGHPLGVTIANGKVITNEETGGSTSGIIGFNKDDVLILKRSGSAHQLVAEGIRDAVTMGPFLIVNGKASFIKGNGGWGYAARTAIGQREDGVVLFLVVDSNVTRTKGASMVDLTEIMQKYGAINAANLDGGTSSVIAENGELINDPIDSTGAHKSRGVPTIFMVK